MIHTLMQWSLIASIPLIPVAAWFELRRSLAQGCDKMRALDDSWIELHLCSTCGYRTDSYGHYTQCSARGGER